MEAIQNAEDEGLIYLAGGGIAAMLLGMALVPLRDFTSASNFAFPFMALTIAVAEFGGRRSAVVTALVSALSWDFFLTQPYMRLTIAGKHDIIAFVGLAVCGLIAAAFGSRRRRKTADLGAARGHLDLVHATLQELESPDPVEQVLPRILDEARAALPLAALSARDEKGRLLAASGQDRDRAMPRQVLRAGTLLPDDVTERILPREGCLFRSRARGFGLWRGAGRSDGWSCGEAARARMRRPGTPSRMSPGCWGYCSLGAGPLRPIAEAKHGFGSARRKRMKAMFAGPIVRPRPWVSGPFARFSGPVQTGIRRALLQRRPIGFCLLLLSSCVCLLAQEQESPAPESKQEEVAEEGEKPAEQPKTAKLEIKGFVDVYFVYNFNRPVDHANFFPGTGTSAKRDNEFAINLAQVDFIVAPKPVGVHIAAGYGNSMEVVHAAEVDGVATSPGVWRNLLQASLEVQTHVGKGLFVQAGLFPSHIGFEAFQTKDNWNYTRSWEAELTPYYQMGVKLAYPLGERWSAQVHFLNGWQVIADNNRGKSLGWQFAYAGDKVSLTFNGIVGPELPDDDQDLRALLDTVALWKATPDWSFALCLDLGGQEQPTGGSERWNGLAFYARLAPQTSKAAFALRAEYYDDDEGAISGTSQTLEEVTATFELRPLDRLILKFEGRYDHSTAEVFAGDGVDPTGEAIRDQHDEALLLVGAVVTF